MVKTVDLRSPATLLLVLALLVHFERFSLEYRKVIGLTSLGYTICLKNSRHFFIQSEVKPKPVVTCSLASVTSNYFVF